MDAKELRIGNWINWTKPNPKPTYEQIYILSDNEINESLPDAFQPIPLTPEILEKAGFEIIGNKWKLKNISIGLGNSFISCLIGQTFIEPSLKHLHQLQNLYFTLTGEELQIEL